MVIQALSEIESEDLVQEERARKAAVRKSKMDADLDAESKNRQSKWHMAPPKAFAPMGSGGNLQKPCV